MVQSKTEKKKLVLAIVLGILAVIAVGYNLLGIFSSPSKPAVPPVASTQPQSERFPAETGNQPGLRTESPIVIDSSEIAYSPETYSGGAARRNIFAFYEPPPKPQPTPRPLPTPKPTPPPPQTIVAMSPSSSFAGGKGFRFEVSGSNFTADTKIYFNEGQLQTTFINSQRLAANISGNMVSTEGVRNVQVKTADGRLYSNLTRFNVLPPPRPAFSFLGATLRARSNNATAYIQEQSGSDPVARRLNDVLGGRFRIVNITPSQVVVEDTALGFRHTVPVVPQSAIPAQAAPFRPVASGIIVDSGVANPNVNPNPNPNQNQNPNVPPRPSFQNPRRPPQPPPNQDTTDDDSEDTDG